ncbi:MAG: hypothetical protein QNJ20_04020 [Paracoccaceae bacterium]|nr:hypothetical protein [Paracoccaceae bacterium]
MTWRIDQPVRAGTNIFAAIVETRINVLPTCRAVVGHGDKRPVLFLVHRGETVSGWDIHGNPCTEAEIERRYPTAIDQLKALSNQQA